MNSTEAPEPTAQAPQGPDRARELALEFRGSAREYFRIWAVNLCLTLLTAGIFSAWAKVRKKRYFYSHTLLDGTPFQYLGQPIPILKGRIVAAVLFLIYYASSHFFTSTLPYVIVAGIVLAPWVIVRSAAFNARYTAFRNMTFTFNAGYWGAVKTVYAWGLIPALVVGSVFDWGGNYLYAGLMFGLFGLAFPFWIKRLKEFIVGNTVFGGRQAAFSATGGQFFRIYFIAGVIVMIAGVATGLLAAALFPSMKGFEYAFIVAALPIYFGYVLAYAYVQARSGNLVWNSSRLGPLRFKSSLKGRGLAKLYITNALAIVASVGLLTPWAVMRTLKYRVDHLKALLDGDLTDFSGGEATAVQAAGAELGEFFDVDLSL